MTSLDKLSPAALSAAMRGGTAEWGQRGSVLDHIVYIEPQDARGSHYLKCLCGCGTKAKYRAMANGICMYEGCELSARRLAKAGPVGPRLVRGDQSSLKGASVIQQLRAELAARRLIYERGAEE